MSAPDPALGPELLAVIARLNRWATRHAELRLPPAQGRLLAQIDELGPARISDLARADHCSQPTMTTQVQRLEEQGWVTRVTDPADARAVLISLTPAGKAELAEVREARVVAVRPLIEALDAARRERLQEAVSVLEELLDVAYPRPDQDEQEND